MNLSTFANNRLNQIPCIKWISDEFLMQMECKQLSVCGKCKFENEWMGWNTLQGERGESVGLINPLPCMKRAGMPTLAGKCNAMFYKTYSNLNFSIQLFISLNFCAYEKLILTLNVYENTYIMYTHHGIMRI